MIITGANWEEVWPLVRDHHYAHRRTADPMFCFAWRLPGGLFGDTGEPQAAIVFTAPVNRYFGEGAVEIARVVRLPSFTSPLSQFIRWTTRWLKCNTNLRYCLSYADRSAGHHGGIYQASNFIYLGESAGNRHYENPNTGEIVSGRAFDQRRPEYREGWKPVRTANKFLYVLPLNEPKKKLLKRFGWQELPYPKPGKSADGDSTLRRPTRGRFHP